MDNPSTHPSLFVRLRDDSDGSAWREFESRYRKLILRYARRKGLQPADADDVLQIVLFNLSKRLRRQDEFPQRSRGRFRDYLGRMVQNVVITYQTKKLRAPRAGLTDEIWRILPEEDSHFGEPDWETEWVAHHYRTAVRSLRESHDARIIGIFERLLAGEPMSMVAQTLNMSVDAVAKIRQRLARRLRELIAAQVREEDERHV